MSETDDNTYYVTSDDGNCAQIYPLHVWERVAQKFQEPPRMDPAKMKLQRFTSYYGLLTQMDPQGRILIPPSLRSYAGLDKEVVILGMPNRFEIWDRERWDVEVSRFEKEGFEDPELAREIDSLGI